MYHVQPFLSFELWPFDYWKKILYASKLRNPYIHMSHTIMITFHYFVSEYGPLIVCFYLFCVMFILVQPITR